MFSWIQSSAGVIPGDTLNPYSFPIWQAWRVVSDLQRLDRMEVLLDSAGAVIALKNIALDKANKTIAAQDSSYQAKDNEAKECRLMDGAKDQLHKTELKDERKKGRKEGGILIGAIFTLLDILLILAL